MTPTQRTIAHLKERGYRVGIVERFIQRGGPIGFRSDLFNIIDLIAIKPGEPVLGVQSTGQDFAAHMRKLTEEYAQSSIDWLATGHSTLELYGWRKVKVKRGGKAVVWKPRHHVFDLKQDFGNLLAATESPLSLGQAASHCERPATPSTPDDGVLRQISG